MCPCKVSERSLKFLLSFSCDVPLLCLETRTVTQTLHRNFRNGSVVILQLTIGIPALLPAEAPETPSAGIPAPCCGNSGTLSWNHYWRNSIRTLYTPLHIRRTTFNRSWNRLDVSFTFLPNYFSFNSFSIEFEWIEFPRSWLKFFVPWYVGDYSYRIVDILASQPKNRVEDANLHTSRKNIRGCYRTFFFQQLDEKFPISIHLEHMQIHCYCLLVFVFQQLSVLAVTTGIQRLTWKWKTDWGVRARKKYMMETSI